MSSGTSRDLYGEARQLADAFVQRGEHVVAQRLIEAIESGSTSSEILFGLRWELDRLLDRGVGGDAHLFAWVSDLQAAIESTLG